MIVHPTYILYPAVPLADVGFLKLLHFSRVMSQLGCSNFPDDFVAKPVDLAVSV